ncbi:MAG: hypothetical protein QG670_1078 [Thermoproteota archaeon]|nr:hypothetical protein [Thermoproteota archaeon]
MMGRTLNYDVGIIITLTISVGSAIIAYAGGFVVYDVYNLPAWIFGPLGVYTLVYAYTKKESSYFSAGGITFLAIAMMSMFYRLVNVVVMIGIFLIVVGVMATITYMREPKKTLQK